MSRKDYIKLAYALKLAAPCNWNDRTADDTWRDCIAAVADVLKADNDRFQRERFARACGAES